MEVSEYIKQQIHKPFVWGDTDCCKTIDNWLIIAEGYSHLQKFGFDYSTKEEAEKLMSDHGNMLFLMLKIAELDGAIETDEPQAGDIGVIVLGKNDVCGAICDGEFWFTRNERGISYSPVNETRRIKVWKTCHKQLS